MNIRTEDLIDRFAPASRKAFLLGFGLAFCVLVLTVLAAAVYFRSVVRNQIAGRDAEALHATTILEELDVREDFEGELEDDQVGFEAALRASRLKGVLGIRFFDRAGKFQDSFPANVHPKDLNLRARQALRTGLASSKFTPQMPLDQVFIYLPEFATGAVSKAPVLEIVVPLSGGQGTNGTGSAQFILEGASIAVEYARLDRNIAFLAASVVLVSGMLLFGMLWPVFRKLERLNEELASRGERLLRANQELALAARTSALGAVSAHLMHGLKNPLASLAQFVRNRTETGATEPGDDDSRDALSATRRMQALVEETLEVLSDARGEPGYRMTVRELVGMIERTFSTRAAKRNVRLEIGASADFPLSSRRANLVRLILGNLLDNAIEATPPEKTVRLVVQAPAQGKALKFIVKDEGSGFPEHLRGSVFLPCKSTREGGGGVGLAISHQIAEYLGAKIELSESSASGCSFVLELPVEEGEIAHSASPRLGASAQHPSGQDGTDSRKHL